MANKKTIKLASGTFPVEGMMCAVCAGTVEKTVRETPGVVKGDVNFAASSVSIEWDPKQTSAETISQAVKAAGYDMIVVEDAEEAARQHEEAEARRYRNMKRDVIVAWILTLPLCVICMGPWHFPGMAWVMMAMALAVMVLAGHRFYISGFRNLLKGHPNMDSLVAVSTIVSFLFSLVNTIWPHLLVNGSHEAGLYYEGAAMIIAFVSTGKLMEMRARRSTGNALRALMGLQPREALLRQADGNLKTVEITSLKKGDVVAVRPGDRVPVDGKVVEGHASVDESMLTGEPIAVFKEEGAEVRAGTICQNGSIMVEASQVGASTELSRIIESVRKAQGSKAPVQRLADKISGVFVPVVMGISLLTFLGWWLFGGQGLPIAVTTAVSVLVIACPCALGLATPTAIMVGIGRGARHGILVKDAEALERLSHIDILALDKTGTLTRGLPESTEQIRLGEAAAEAADILYTLERKSSHPLAIAICRTLEKEGAKETAVAEIENLPGLGVKGDGYWIGSERLAASQGAAISEKDAAEISRWLGEGAGVVIAGKDDKALLAFKVADTLRDDARETIAELKRLKVTPVLLTGDRRQTAEYIAREAGIEKVVAEVLPRDKQKEIQALKDGGKQVAMAGDGINDAAALAEADVSIAMGSGSDIAIETAMLTVVGGRLASIPEAIKLSGRTLRIIKENLFWAFIYNLIGIPLAAGVLFPAFGLLLTPMFASAAMALSSVCVVLNSLRLK